MGYTVATPMEESQFPSSLSRPANAAWVRTFVHDLRQPLSTIQNSVCYLKLILEDNPRALAQLDLIEHQVEEADALLSNATVAVRQAGSQRTEGVGDGNFAFTNAETAGVT